ncbi:hemolysin family protein [Phycisphaerales bacterium AB-hyl4]|uniref:Hemolysin family protein n=1 Tax=Natronomicrosphaera hydrolytica TaxID=3242702 RepID=A0ABV4U8X8_9BACT
MTLLLTYLFVALAISFLCSLLEAALLSVPRSHVAVMVEQGSRAGQRLQQMKDDVDRPLAAILTLNTFAHTLGAAGVGAQATLIWGEVWVGVVSFVVTLLILIFSEIIPKTLGAVHAKGLAGFTAWTVHGMILMLLPVVLVCDWISKLLSGRNQAVPLISRDEVRSLARLAHEEGAIDQSEARVMRNLIALREATVEQVMTPRTVVYTLRADQTVREVTEGEPLRFARVPVVGESLDDVKGLIYRHDLFKARSDGRADATLGELAQPVHAVPEVAKLPAVLEEFLQRRAHLFLVVDEYGGTAGIVTLEDVLETLLGVEIMDETDAVEDMRQLAKQLLNARRRGEGRR